MIQHPSDSSRSNEALPAPGEGIAPSADRVIPSAAPDTQIKVLAARQHGVVSRWQLLRAGISRHWIDLHLKRGWLEPVHRGVYQVGPVSAPHQREMAALLACGAGAVLSHQTAAALWELLPPFGPKVPVTVSTRRNLRGRSSGIHVYRVRSLGADEVSSLGNLHLTSPSRTLLDLAGSLSARELERAMSRADRQRLLDRKELELLLSRYPRRPGRTSLLTLLASPDGPVLTRSEAEERFIALIRKGGLRPPEMNVMVKGFEVDAFWRAERLVVEVDGFAFHSARAAFERDRQRDGVLMAAGLRVIRITWCQLTLAPEALLVQLAQTLAASGAP
jgi:very-short-patch-repair endonuclease/predicted transcriptional regulator of viral defense system